MPRYVFVFLLFPVLLPAPSTALADASLNIDNPIVLQRADPWIHRDETSSCYTFVGTAPEFDRIELRQACRLNDLKLAEPVVVWRKPESGPMSANIWAPELHRIGGVWYIHFAAGDVEKRFSIRMYALSNSNDDPARGEWREEGQIVTHLDSFSLDATTFEHRGQRHRPPLRHGPPMGRRGGRPDGPAQLAQKPGPGFHHQ